MKPIAIFSYDYPPNDGGISRLSAAVVTELLRRGREVRVLTLTSAGRVGLVRPLAPTTEVGRRRPQRDWATFRFIRSLSSDVTVLTTIWNPEGTLAWLAGRRDSVVLAHGNEVMPYPSSLRYAIRRWLRRRVLAAVRVVVCNSIYTERLVRAACPTARTVVITPGVDAIRFQPMGDTDVVKRHLGLPIHKRILLSVSRMDAYKGHDVVLRAMAAMPVASRVQLHYVVAGKGSQLDELRALSASLGVDDCVTWLGFVDDATLPSLYACADLFVLCTREDPAARGVEGFGMAFLEAQAAGVAVLGTRAGGIPDAIVEGQGGWLVDQDDVDGVRGHLIRLAEDVAPFRAQGVLGRERARAEGSWERYVSRLLSVLEDNQ